MDGMFDGFKRRTHNNETTKTHAAPRNRMKDEYQPTPFLPVGVRLVIYFAIILFAAACGLLLTAFGG